MADKDSLKNGYSAQSMDADKTPANASASKQSQTTLTPEYRAENIADIEKTFKKPDDDSSIFDYFKSKPKAVAKEPKKPSGGTGRKLGARIGYPGVED